MFGSPIIAETCALARFAGRVFREGFRPRYEVRELLYQCYVIGYQSLPLVGITGFIMGLVLTLRLRPTMVQFGAESWIPTMVGLTIINNSQALWELLNDESLAPGLHQSLRNVGEAASHLSAASHDVRAITRGVRQGRGPIGYLLTDKAFAGQLGHAAGQLAGTSDTLAATLTGLKRQVQAGGGPLHTLLSDTAMRGQLRQSVQNVAQGTQKLDQSMEALQHNFLLRGYFRRQEKKKAKALEKQAQARLAWPTTQQ